jgi:hypothetical protein
VRRALILVGLLAAACGSGPASRCEAICDQEARCADDVSEKGAPRAKFDAGECSVACKALDRDAEGRALVDKHILCVEHAATCAAKLACD